MKNYICVYDQKVISHNDSEPPLYLFFKPNDIGISKVWLKTLALFREVPEYQSLKVSDLEKTIFQGCYVFKPVISRDELEDNFDSENFYCSEGTVHRLEKQLDRIEKIDIKNDPRLMVSRLLYCGQVKPWATLGDY